MRENQHTPGPWVASKGVDDEPDRWCVLTDGGHQYFIAEIHNGAPGDTLETEGANARLMAAAPDLLAACKKAADGDLFAYGVAGVGGDKDNRDRCIAEARSLMAEARAAVAKAEGRV